MSVPTFNWPEGVHPAADLFPMMDADAFAELVESVSASGLREPAWVTKDGQLLDGRNRVAACQAANVNIATRTYDGDDPVGFVLDLNVHRRHLTAGQRAMAALDAEKLYAEEAKEREHARKTRTVADLPQSEDAEVEPRFKARDKAAKAAGVSSRAVGQAKRVAKESPELAEQVKKGEVSLDAAEKRVAAQAPRSSQRSGRRSPFDVTTKRIAHDLASATSHIESLMEDDRFSLNKGQVASDLSGHLSRAVDACQQLTARLTES